MREIKFRAWQKYHKEMLEVINLTFNKGKITSLTVRYGENYGNISQIYSEISKDFGLYEDGKMILELMQYTGLKDKNGVEIYDGDCFRGKSGVKIVKYKEGAFVTEYKFNIRGYEEVSILPLMVTSSESVVIGNIYENPELLEVRNG